MYRFIGLGDLLFCSLARVEPPLFGNIAMLSCCMFCTISQGERTRIVREILCKDFWSICAMQTEKPQ